MKKISLTFALILFFVVVSQMVAPKEVEAATIYYYLNTTSSSSWQTTTNPATIPAFYGSVVFPILPGATYYYLNTSSYWQTTTNPSTIPARYTTVVFPIITGATYYYLNRGIDNTWQTTTNPSSMPAYYGGHYTTVVFPTITGTTYYYMTTGSTNSWKTTTTTTSMLPSNTCSVFPILPLSTSISIYDSSINQAAPLDGSITISGIANGHYNDTNFTISATINGQTRSQTINNSSSGEFSLSWTGSSLGTGSWSGIIVSASGPNGGTATATYTGTIKTGPSIIYLPCIAFNAFPRVWNSTVKNYTSYGSSIGIVFPQNILTYDGSTNKINLNFIIKDPNYLYTNAKMYVGLYGSGANFGNCAVNSTTIYKCYSFTGEWSLPTYNNLYGKCGGIFLEYECDGSIAYLQFDASKVLYDKTLSYSVPITVVNGKAFSITLPNTNGKFVGTNSTYGTLTGTASGSNTILIGTLSGVPSSYTSLNIGLGTIQIRGVAAPSTSTASVSFY